ncbi:hypothetical protein BJ508DRAFT_164405 [Ascobolus immersus RN42]|uniref:Uncharacterized protein n=1 Tax=Ascobolus immersus RN42 TaxID=1160509 RepID=A0A3N4HZ45_ASCIM|nr:hypothetical protein BJ508DRAFT_164405 [Ascobolus immersus RN42]
MAEWITGHHANRTSARLYPKTTIIRQIAVFKFSLFKGGIDASPNPHLQGHPAFSLPSPWPCGILRPVVHPAQTALLSFSVLSFSFFSNMLSMPRNNQIDCRRSISSRTFRSGGSPGISKVSQGLNSLERKMLDFPFFCTRVVPGWIRDLVRRKSFWLGIIWDWDGRGEDG